MKKNLCIFAGTFDPFTNGHLDILKKIYQLFDEIIIAIGVNEKKKASFTLEDRKKMIELATQNLSKIKILNYQGLLIDFAASQQANFLLRGIRTSSDFDYEVQIQQANSSINSEIKTIFMAPSLEFSFISSSLVRTIYMNKSQAYSSLVPPKVFDFMEKCRKEEK